MVGAIRKREVPEGKKGKCTGPWKMPTFRAGQREKHRNWSVLEAEEDSRCGATYRGVVLQCGLRRIHQVYQPVRLAFYERSSRELVHQILKVAEELLRVIKATDGWVSETFET